ncbi:leucyl aminopeptidase [Desulfonatronum thiosulfatophilum]|uniref:Probable cytosol aminopeptidase n=1 Tax=Desulfonatronum thiosulfatophilum TaxID=617002 RepID=A0A1G6CHL5_9BACT|nr:leucyl aminopeptidase [Desulfonatronum thiosulfatophilum]SDB32403.1 leucyl aminopeptidase [Desulfonatronum thiosulfatophilum]
MEITLHVQGVHNCEALVFFAFEKEGEMMPAFKTWLGEKGAWLAENPLLIGFSGRKKSVRYFFSPTGTESPMVILVGLGKRDVFMVRELRQAVAAAMGCAADLELKCLGLDVAVLADTGLEATLAVEEAICAVETAAYKFERLKTNDNGPKKNPTEFRLIAAAESEANLRGSMDKARAVGMGLRLTRDLVNMPSNLATPEYLATAARETAKRHDFGIEVLEADEIEALGMGAFAAVFQARREQARLIILDTHPDQGAESQSRTEAAEADKPLVVIGKGITFDTGGISLKPSQGMEEMKGDMAGAAAVIGFFEAYGQLKSRRRVVGIIPCTENLTGSRAIKPGEVVKTFSGKSVEIVNTDAEGRLLLCDVLSYAGKYDPHGIVDLATLTGAMVVALGPQIAGAFTPQKSLSALIREIGERVGEPCWPMPLWEGYQEELKSEVADLKNVGSREGGAIHAAMFLQRFVPKNTPWIHVDIAGPAYSKKKTDLGISGGTGFGVRTLLELVQEWPENFIDDGERS